MLNLYISINPQPLSTNEELMFIICWMLHPEVGFRAKLTDVIKYPWFTRQVDINNYDYDTVLAGMWTFIFFIYISRMSLFTFSG